MAEPNELFNRLMVLPDLGDLDPSTFVFTLIATIILFPVVRLFVYALSSLLLSFALKGFVKDCTDPFEMPTLRPLRIPIKSQSNFPMKKFVHLYEPRQWQLTEHWFFTLDDKDRTEIIIPKGFICDGASIPRIFWPVASPVGALFLTGLIHDYGYKYKQLWKRTPEGKVEPYEKGRERLFWDGLFRKVGKQVNGLPLMNWFAWFVLVVVGGWIPWWSHRRDDLQPVKPILEH